ncbi:sterol desaturase family protein [Pontibacter sp. G13]|uniref:sterol desaturase family protein n=1 Tax=Pontibacter sp. G13 TaxID=3074898 RepID=UPI00288A87C3|nr:sterol desaturase family protein [Pontibacter sp. G13]WNJ16984.1 sterol desaturase family protein [Pontibacter sp. G13]
MDALITYFENMPSLHRSIFLVSGLAFFMMLETAAPLFRFSYKRGRHALLNILFTLTTALVNLPLAFLLVKASDWTVASGFGVLQWIEMPLWAQMVVGLLMMDFIGAWLIHYIEHHVKFMWKFHLIHHSDQHVDTTTGNRHHPGESIFRFTFTALAILITGAPMWLVFLYQTLSVILTQFNHSNVKMPAWLDNALQWVVCTPNMHRVHHHYRMPYSDSNYGNLFSFWDRIFGTFKKVDNTKLVYGVDTHMDYDEHSNAWTMLKIPFLPYRSHVEYSDSENLEDTPDAQVGSA